MNIPRNLPGKMLALQLRDKTLLYNSYMSFLEHGGLFVPTDDTFSLGDEVLLSIEIINHPDKKFLPTKVAWINPARTSAHRPKGIGLAFGSDEISVQTKNLIEAELAGMLRNDRTTFTL
ncbi:PilZ domain-containing protein [Uruburuella testudinis]|uniref:PilZ domain-containing protein n=1 Tax=Uruburuella testudinis TaxID=1282863 RepID=A0ABY4DT63_9NEIS|nr:PilZ domain-containing protein [Uruburuella testudinis]UOO81204.1 PilZ domain-containing protein [Uruburuella testudinis]